MENVEFGPDPSLLQETVVMKMPFGKYKGTLLADLPMFYLEYFLRKGGFPKGKLGMMLATVYEIKLNGLDSLFERLKNSQRMV